MTATDGGRIVDQNAKSLQVKEQDYGESNETPTKRNETIIGGESNETHTKRNETIIRGESNETRARAENKESHTRGDRRGDRKEWLPLGESNETHRSRGWHLHG